MRLLLISSLLVLLFADYISTASLCDEETGEEIDTNSNELQPCSETEYYSYVECVRKRMKRQVSNCQSSRDECSECDCDYCEENTCESTCSSCCARSQCTTHHCCHRTCQSQCRTSSCRRSCRKDCVQKVESREVISQVVPPSSSSSEGHHNITTVIQLHNTINNTNLIDVPIVLNNTNYNNVTVAGGSYDITGGSAITTTEEKTKEHCCHLLSPRRCVYVPQPPYQKCFHVRSKHCGRVCHSSTVHVQKHSVCDDESHHCRDELIYLPQPKPRCVHQQRWPFVQCGMLEAECGGCYAHHSDKQLYAGGCPSACFDDGYDSGPIYRQGPFYRPGYAPFPSCYQLGNCPSNNGLPLGYQYDGGLYGGAYPPNSYNPEYFNVGIGGGLPQTEGLETADFYQKIKRGTEKTIIDADNIAPSLVQIQTKIEEPNDDSTKQS